MANKYTASSYITDTHAKCSYCKEIKTLDNFGKDSKLIYRKGYSYYCKPCAALNSRKNHAKRILAKDIEYTRGKKNQYIKNRFGITLNEYEEKLKAQNFTCAICGVELPTGGTLTHLDHCHATGKIRAFLCTNCNRGLGHFKDSTANLTSAIAYLNTHKSDVT